MVKMDGALVT